MPDSDVNFILQTVLKNDKNTEITTILRPKSREKQKQPPEVFCKKRCS